MGWRLRDQPPLRLGIAGFGAAARAFVPAMQQTQRLGTGGGGRALAHRGRGHRRGFGLAVYDSLARMLAEAEVDAVYVATPTELHVDHVLQAIAAGQDGALVEKPMAARLADARRMVEAAEAAGVVFLVGHSHSYDLPIRRCARPSPAANSAGCAWSTPGATPTGCTARAGPMSWTGSGGGVTFRQGSHQFDILRLLCGGLRRARAPAPSTGTRDAAPPAPTRVLLDFENGAVATAVYNGYGGLSSMDLCFDISEWGLHPPAATRAWARRNTGRSSADELAGQAAARRKRPSRRSAFPALLRPDCGELRTRRHPRVAQGLLVSDARRHARDFAATDQSPRDLVMAEFHAAIFGSRPAFHDGRWGLANLAVCEAVVASSPGTARAPGQRPGRRARLT